MAQNNTRDVNPDDFASLDVPTYQAPAGSTAAHTGSSAQAETASFPAASAAHPDQYATETIAVDREPVYIPPAEPVYEEVPVAAEEPAVVEHDAKRGTIDLGLLILRLVFGGYLILSAVSTFFRLGGSEGIADLERAYAAYPYGNGLAIMVPTLELAAGVFLVLGLIAPVASAVAVAVTTFVALHALTESGAGLDIFAWDASVWLPVILLGIALTLQFTGPGYYGIDGGRSWARRPLASSWIWAIVGIAAAVAVWWFGAGVNPLNA